LASAPSSSRVKAQSKLERVPLRQCATTAAPPTQHCGKSLDIGAR